MRMREDNCRFYLIKRIMAHAQLINVEDDSFNTECNPAAVGELFTNEKQSLMCMV